MNGHGQRHRAIETLEFLFPFPSCNCYEFICREISVDVLQDSRTTSFSMKNLAGMWSG